MAKEYIEREALKEDLEESYNRLKMIYDSLPPYGEDKLLCGRELCAFLEAILRVKAAPAADVVEVVRCKDCRFRSPKYDEPDGYYGCDLKLLAIDLDCFCSEGERRKNGDKQKKSGRGSKNAC